MGIDFRRPRHIRGFRLGEVLVWDFTSKPLVEKTVSGSVVAFSDGADAVPLKSCAVTIAPTLDGVSSVEVVSGGKNFIDDNSTNIEQGTISGSMGTNVSANNRVRNINMIPFPLDEIRASYSLTIPTDYKLAMRFYKEDGTFVEPSSWAMGFINQIPQSYVGQGVKWARFVFAKTDDSAITPEDIANVGYQIEVGSTATAYEPYVAPTIHTANLGRTIYGGSVDVVNGIAEPKNWIDDNLANLEQGSIESAHGNNTTSSKRVRNANYTPFPYDEIYSSYKLTIPTGWRLALRFFKADNTYVSLPSWAVGFVTSLPSELVGQGVEKVRFVFAKTDDSDITPEDVKNIGYMLEKGNTATPYSPYFEPFTFTHVPILSRLGDNTLWGDGDLSITYYAYAG